MSTSKRETLLKEFENCEKAIISNARCLTEGVNVPTVDMVAFISPKKSKIDIVQAAGRAMRKSEGKEFGYILIPLFVQMNESESVEQALEKTQFDAIWDVLQAIQEQDESMVEIIGQMKEELGRTLGYNDNRLRERIEILGPELSIGEIRKAISSTIIDRLGAIWDERFGQLLRFKENNGHCNISRNDKENKSLGMWVATQRHLYSTNSKRLKPERINKLNEVGFDWDPSSAQWEKMFICLLKYKEKNGNSNISQRDFENQQLATWAAEQRKDYKKGKLRFDRIKKLESLDFIFDVLNTRWENIFLDLCAFKQAHGHCNVPHNYVENLQLSTWVKEQRKAYKRNKVSLDRISKLNSIGFCWTPLDMYQEKMLKELYKFKNENGHCNVPQNYKISTLGKWIIAQRLRYKKGKLTPDMIDHLNSIGIDWHPLDTIWVSMYQALCDFKCEYGHCIVPQNYSKDLQLGNWVSVQRSLYSTNRLSEDRIEKLNSIGFIWNRYEAQWEEMYQTLSNFKIITGHCNIPYGFDNYSLVRWVSTQRILYKKNQLRADRIDKLKLIGFCWNDSIDQAWNLKFDELCEFKKNNGHSNIPLRYAANRSLGAWTNMQRLLLKKGKLSSERIQKLSEIGFVFDHLREMWEKKYLELCAFKNLYSHCIVPATYKNNPSLGTWVSKQRLEYRQQKLSSERIALLNKIGFVWEPKIENKPNN